MPDYSFGRGTSDYVFEVVGDQQYLRPATDVTFWDSQTGGEQITGLKDANNVAIDSNKVTSDSHGALPRFSAPVTSMWADAGADRFIITSTDLAEIAAGAVSTASPNVAFEGNVSVAGTTTVGAITASTVTTTALNFTGGGTLIPDRRFNVLSYGASRNGTKAGGGTDDTAAIQAAINAAGAAGGGIVYLPAGGYKIAANPASANALSNTNPHVFLKGDGMGTTYLWHSYMTTSGLHYVYKTGGGFFPAMGTGSTLLTADAGWDQSSYPNSVAVNVASTAGLAVGDFIMIGDNFDEALDTNGWIDRFRGEYVRIRAITGNTITLWSSLRDDYTTARSAQVWKAAHNTDCGIQGLSILAADGVQHNTYTGGIVIGASTNTYIADVEIAGMDAAGVAIGYTVDTLIQNPFIHDLTNDPAIPAGPGGTPPAQSSKLGYNISVGPSDGTVITGGILKNGRHGVTTGGANFHAGWARGLTVTGVRLEESDAAALDTHPATSDVHFIGNHVDRCRSIGISCRSVRATISGNTIDRTGDAGIWIDRKSSVEVNVIGNTIIQPGGYYNPASPATVYGHGIFLNGRRVDPDAPSAGDTDGVPSKVVIANNLVRQAWLAGVRFTIPTTDLVVAGNTFEFCGLSNPGGTSAVQFNVDDPVPLTNLRVEYNRASGVNAVVAPTGGTCSNGVFVGNSLTNGVGTAPSAVKGIVHGTNGNVVHGNVNVTAAGSGLTQMDLLQVSGGLGLAGTAPVAGVPLRIDTATTGTKLFVRRTSTGDSSSVFNISGGEATTVVIGYAINSEAAARRIDRASGTIEWGSGTGSTDTSLGRTAVGNQLGLGAGDSFFLPNITEPATPTGGCVIYATGGALKIKKSDGTVITPS